MLLGEILCDPVPADHFPYHHLGDTQCLNATNHQGQEEIISYILIKCL